MTEIELLTHKSDLHFDSVEQEAYLNLWRTYDRLRMLEDEVFREFDLTAQQYNVLRLLKAARPGRVATLTLAAQLVSKAPDITRMVDRLVDRGYVDKERGELGARRNVYVGITDEGVGLLKALRNKIFHCHRKQFGHMTDDELLMLTELLWKARKPHEPEDSQWG
jgi:DNA-binding MarR family transcriptional regulator